MSSCTFDLCNFSCSAVQLKPSLLSYWFEMNIVLQKQDRNYAINYILSSNKLNQLVLDQISWYSQIQVTQRSKLPGDPSNPEIQVTRRSKASRDPRHLEIQFQQSSKDINYLLNK